MRVRLGQKIGPPRRIAEKIFENLSKEAVSNQPKQTRVAVLLRWRATCPACSGEPWGWPWMSAILPCSFPVMPCSFPVPNPKRNLQVQRNQGFAGMQEAKQW